MELNKCKSQFFVKKKRANTSNVEPYLGYNYRNQENYKNQIRDYIIICKYI